MCFRKFWKSLERAKNIDIVFLRKVKYLNKKKKKNLFEDFDVYGPKSSHIVLGQSFEIFKIISRQGYLGIAFDFAKIQNRKFRI